GTTDIDLATEPVGVGADGKSVYLKDIWPTQQEVADAIHSAVLPEMFRDEYDNVWEKNPQWNAIKTTEGNLYAWDEASTYIQEPPFLVDLAPEPSPIQPIRNARVLVALGD